jgi:hypothetical protein
MSSVALRSAARRFIRPWRASLAAGLLLSGCIVFVGPGDHDGHLRDLVSARARWNAQGSSNYEFVVRQLCYCIFGGQSVKVTVRQGAVVSAVKLGDGQALPSEYFDGFATVEQMFDMIDDAISDRAHSIRATYDATFGFPTDFFIDYREQVADEERGFEATDYSELPQPGAAALRGR